MASANPWTEMTSAAVSRLLPRLCDGSIWKADGVLHGKWPWQVDSDDWRISPNMTLMTQRPPRQHQQPMGWEGMMMGLEWEGMMLQIAPSINLLILSSPDILRHQWSNKI